MHFVVNRDVLNDAVSFVVKLLPQRTTLPILSGVLIEASEGQLSLASFDYEVSSRTTIPAEVIMPGTMLVSGRLLAEITGRLPAAPVTVTTADTKVTVRCGTAQFTLLSMPVAEYPELPAIGSATGTVPGEAFGTTIGRVVSAASRDDVTPVITGLLLEFTQDALSLITTDRYRVAIADIPWEAHDEQPASALVPARIMQEVGRTLGHAPVVEIALTRTEDRELIAFTAGDRTVTSLLIKGNYPPVRRLFPASVPNHAVVNTADLTDATKRVSLVVDRESALRFSFDADGLTLEAIGNEQAQASEQVDAVLAGEDTVVSLKPQFLLDGIAGVGSEFLNIGFTSTENPNKPGPVLITAQHAGDGPTDTFRYLLQPNLLLR